MQTSYEEWCDDCVVLGKVIPDPASGERAVVQFTAAASLVQLIMIDELQLMIMSSSSRCTAAVLLGETVTAKSQIMQNHWPKW